MKKKNKSNGFALVEVIVSIIILSFLASSIYLTFAQGLRLWKFAVRERPDWKIDVFTEQLTEDLRNIFLSTDNSFAGDKTSIDFNALNAVGEFKKPTRVFYIFDQSKQTIFRGVKTYEGILNPKNVNSLKTVPVLDKIENLSFEFYEFNKKDKTKNWKTKWQLNCLPRTVKVNIDYHDSTKSNVVKFINLPASNGCLE